MATAGSGDGAVVGASTGDALRIRELMAETTSTFLEATTAAPSTTTSTTSTTSATSTVGDAPANDPADAPSTTAAAAATTAPAGRTTPEATTTTSAAPATTAAPTTTTTTAPPATTTTAPPTTTTTAPPESSGSPESSEGEEQYAYDDPRSTQVWYDLADCEAGGDWYIDTGNGYYGGLQFSLASWESVGGSGYPNEHPPETQIEMGRRLQARQGWDAWPHCAEKLGLR